LFGAERLSYVGEVARREDHYRFMCTLFAPKSIREDLFALLAFNVEVARIPDLISEVSIGQIRLQWWRDCISEIFDGGGPPRGHPVAEALASCIGRYDLSRAHFDGLLEARERDFISEDLETMTEFQAYAEGIGSRLACLMLEVLGIRDSVTIEAVGAVGEGWALTGILRTIVFHARSERVYLPKEILDEAGISYTEIKNLENLPRLGEVVKRIAALAYAGITHARSLRNHIDLRAIPVLLLASIASDYLHFIQRLKYDVFHPRHEFFRPSIVKLGLRAWGKTY